MRILVVGGGGREHALAWKLSQEAEIICAPGNPGIAEDVECVPVAQSDFAGLTQLAKDRQIDLVVVGPEDPLIAGLANVLRDNGLVVYGPGQHGAELEGSKAFSKELMFEAGIPTAAFLSFHDPDEAKTYARGRFANGRKVVVKASGNALGKGVVVCDNDLDAELAIDQMMVDRVFGDAGAVVVIEDRLVGWEFSLLTIIGDHNFVSLPAAQDHKRIFDGNKGPNTGGMGTVSPVPQVTASMVAHTEKAIVAPAIERLREQGIAFRGTLFSGLMVEGDDIYCLEYNVRFGDPEIESLVLRVGNGFAQALYQAAVGETIVAPQILDNVAITVFVASGGYPGNIQKGLPIEIGPLPKGVKLFHAGTAMKDSQLVTNGGRVIAVSASGATLDEAREKAYAGAAAIIFDGANYRRDIGKTVNA